MCLVRVFCVFFVGQSRYEGGGGGSEKIWGGTYPRVRNNLLCRAVSKTITVFSSILALFLSCSVRSRAMFVCVWGVEGKGGRGEVGGGHHYHFSTILHYSRDDGHRGLFQLVVMVLRVGKVITITHVASRRVRRMFVGLKNKRCARCRTREPGRISHATVIYYFPHGDKCRKAQCTPLKLDVFAY